jgi:hypothetical protein
MSKHNITRANKGIGDRIAHMLKLDWKEKSVVSFVHQSSLRLAKEANKGISC